MNSAYAVVCPGGYVAVKTVSTTAADAKAKAEEIRRMPWDKIVQEGCRVLPVTITPQEQP